MCKILSAGSDPTLLYTRNSLLQETGAEVVTARTAREAAETILGQHFDLVILCHSFSARERKRLAALLHLHSSSTPLLLMARVDGERTTEETVIDNSPSRLLDAVQLLTNGQLPRAA